MRKLRWAMDGDGFWDLDISTPVTLDGVARPVTGDPLPLGLSRGIRLSRAKQVDFFQRFMAMPVIPSFSPHPHQKGLSIQRLLTLPLPFSHTWFASVLGQLNVQELVKICRKNRSMEPKNSWLQTIKKNISDKSLFALNFCSEILLTPDDTVLLSVEGYGDDTNKLRTKALLHHKFPNHNLTVEAAWPELYMSQEGEYWDVPFTMAIDLASVSSHSGASYHLCLHNSSGSPIQLEGQSKNGVPTTLLAGLCAKCAVSFKKSVDIWRSEASKLKMVQPYDIFLSNPHVSASGKIGAVFTASFGDNSVIAQGENELKTWKGLNFRSQGMNSSILTDLFASVSLSAQHGNFQRMFLDLTRVHAHLDFPCGSKFLSGASSLAYDLYTGKTPKIEAVEAICPQATLSFQQQIGGPFSFRIDSGVGLDLKKRELSVKNPVFAIEYALQVLGSAKAVAWYSLKQKEFMIELRFFET